MAEYSDFDTCSESECDSDGDSTTKPGLDEVEPEPSVPDHDEYCKEREVLN